MKYLVTNIEYDLSELGLAEELAVQERLPKTLTFEIADPNFKCSNLTHMIKGQTGYTATGWIVEFKN